MAQSLAQLHVHVVFSTKNRAPILVEAIRDPFHRYVAVAMKSLKCHVNAINSVDDHVHILFDLHRDVSVSGVMENLKTTTSKWIKTQGDDFKDFTWQPGFGAFAVSAAHVPMVSTYIAGQGEHHRKRSFQDEFRDLLQKEGVPYEERYLWG